MQKRTGGGAFFCAIYIKVRDVKIKERGGKKPFILQLPHFFMGLDAVLLNKTVTVKKITNLFVQQSSNMQQDLVAQFERFHNSDLKCLDKILVIK